MGGWMKGRHVFVRQQRHFKLRSVTHPGALARCCPALCRCCGQCAHMIRSVHPHAVRLLPGGARPPMPSTIPTQMSTMSPAMLDACSLWRRASPTAPHALPQHAGYPHSTLG